LILNNPNYTHFVINLKGYGGFGKYLKEREVVVYDFNLNNPLKFIYVVYKIIKIISSLKPDVLHTWMYHSNLLGGIIGKILGCKKIIWSIHGSFHDSSTKFLTNLIIRFSSFFSYFIPENIIYVSNFSMDRHTKIGYSEKKAIVINNGFSHEELFSPLNMRNKYLLDFKIPDNFKIIGVVSRYHPVKGYNCLFRSLSQMKTKFNNFKCICVGVDISSKNDFMNLVSKYKLEKHIISIGIRNDVPMLMSLFDVLVLSSLSESFPNVLIEAMASGTPCISTDVGDATHIIGKTGWIVPVADAVSLEYSIMEAINEMENIKIWKKRKLDCIKRIEDNFSFKKMNNSYNRLWNF
jgi:glycosyltransferase involved in cell wall biosynthesis